jgi:hypothetical protein
MFATLLAPYNIINKIIFSIIILLMLKNAYEGRMKKSEIIWSPFVIISIFIYGFLYSIPFNNDAGLAKQYLLSTLNLLMIFFINHYKINMSDLSEFFGKVIVLVSAVYFFSNIFFADIGYVKTALKIFESLNSSVSSQRDFISDENIVKFGAISTVSFVYVAWCLTCIRISSAFTMKDLAWLILYGLTIVISGRRGLALISLIFAFSFFYLRSNGLIKFSLLAFFSSITYLVLSWALSETLLFSVSETSNFTKIGHLFSYLEQLSISKFIFGEGLGAYYYSHGVGRELSITELTFIDLSRFLGVPLTIISIIYLVFPKFYVKAFSGNRKYYLISFILYLALSMTNPVLIQSYGMLVILWYWASFMARNDQPNK